MFSTPKPFSHTVARRLTRQHAPLRSDRLSGGGWPGHRRATGLVGLASAALVIGGFATPAAAAAHADNQAPNADTGSVLTAAAAKPQDGNAQSACVSVRPVTEFYEAGRIASFPLTVPRSACTTISVSHISDPAVPSDHCQTFLVGFFPTDGSEATYTEPVTACSVPPNTRTVLASNVPDGVVYRILYDIDYIEPAFQAIRYRAWH